MESWFPDYLPKKNVRLELQTGTCDTLKYIKLMPVIRLVSAYYF